MSSTEKSTENDYILTGVLSRWKAAVDAHDPERVASYFTEDATAEGWSISHYQVSRLD